MKNKLMKIGSSLSLFLMSGAALAQNAGSGRAAGDQVTYLTEVVGTAGLLALGFLFVAGVAILGIAGWFAFRDYVLDQREKKFNIGGLLFAVVIGALLTYPGAAMLMGQDLFTGDNAGVDIQGDDFKRDDN